MTPLEAMAYRGACVRVVQHIGSAHYAPRQHMLLLAMAAWGELDAARAGELTGLTRKTAAAYLRELVGYGWAAEVVVEERGAPPRWRLAPPLLAAADDVLAKLKGRS